jgi:hypothetical protein
MEYSRPPFLPAPCLQRLTTSYRPSYGYAHYFPYLRHRSRDRNGLYHQKTSRIRVPRSDESTPYRHATTHKMGKGQKGSKQCLFLVFYDIGSEYDVFALRPTLSIWLWIYPCGICFWSGFFHLYIPLIHCDAISTLYNIGHYDRRNINFCSESCGPRIVVFTDSGYLSRTMR